jgi:sulfonate transport system permease protein
MSEHAEKVVLPVISRQKRRRSWSKWTHLNNIVIGAAIPVITLIIWQWMYNKGYIDPYFLPSPIGIAAAVRELAVSGQLVEHIGVSFGRVISGFAIGGGLGLLFGLLVGFSRQSEKLLDPMVQLLRMTPHLAVAPLIILWFGFGETSKVLIIANGAFFPLYVNTMLGIRSVDNKLFEVSKVLQFSRFKKIIRLILPSSVPNILLGVRLSLAVSWLGVVVAEMINSKSGVGYLIYFGQYNSRTDFIFVGIIIFAVAGKAVDSFVRLLERKWLSWRDSYKG